jgi:uracil-DNA glycosylase
MDAIERIISKLRDYPENPRVTNPYQAEYARDNLRHYFETMLARPGKRVLLIGEAPGHRGCRLTGIPFTSCRIFNTAQHPVLKELKDKIFRPDNSYENTATMVWQYLASKTVTPLLWNSFPLHPHPLNNPKKNRAPNSDEVAFGIELLADIQALYQPKAVAGIGKKGYGAAKKAFPESRKDIQYIRHPSFGGKKQFVGGMDALLAGG